MKKLVAMAMAALAAAAFADAPTVLNVKAQQRYPWNGLVDIDYTITGDTTGLNLSFSVTDAQDGKTYKPATFLAPPSAAEGTHRATWLPKDDGLSIVSTNIVVTVLLTRTVVPPEPSGGHDKVQLWEGGPYWAMTNIGAEKPEDYGYYFWWGDTIGYKRENDKWVASDGSSSNFSFYSANTPTYNKDVATLQSEGWITADGVLAQAHDAAQVKWGGEWRMPTKDELDALDNNCDWTWTTTNGVNGYIVRGRGDYASASIFLPAAGYGYGSSLYNASSYGFYWSSVPYSGSHDSWSLNFLSSDHYTRSNHRDYGFAVRPVQGFTE